MYIKKMFVIKLCFLIITCLLNTAIAQTFGRCHTPDEYRGSCIFFKSCQSLYQLSQKTPQDNEVRTFISLSQCGSRDGQPLVCCRDHIETSVVPPSRLETATTPKTHQTPSLFPEPGECGIDTQNRIYGGNVTEIDEHPWMAQLLYVNDIDKNPQANCAGSLINSRYVLTASHCLLDIKGLILTHVRLGEWNTETEIDCDDSYKNEKYCNQPVMDILITEIIPHPSYDQKSKNFFNDIGLLRLEKNVQFTDFIKPICLPFDPTLRTNDFVKKTLTVAGWGKTETKYKSNIKLKVNIDAVSNTDCNLNYQKLKKKINIIDTQICAGGVKGQDSCSGDSGGPLMRQNENSSPPYWFLVGIVSYGPKDCGRENFPGVYTRVGKYIEWIQNVVKP